MIFHQMCMLAIDLGTRIVKAQRLWILSDSGLLQMVSEHMLTVDRDPSHGKPLGVIVSKLFSKVL